MNAMARVVLLLTIAVMPEVLSAAEPYELGPDSQRQEGVPVGNVTQHKWMDSKLFSGTERDYWVYVPQQYDATKPACVMVFQDGRNYVNEKG